MDFTNTRVGLLALFLFVLSACRPETGEGFAVYLLADPVPVSNMADQDLSSLTLRDQPLIQQGDIRSYDWEKHRLWLTPGAIHHFQRYEVPVHGVPFVVTVDREPIYSGALFPSYSSLSYHGVAIDPLLPEDGQTVRIQLGYPESPELFEGEDPRGDPRIRAVLEAAGILE
jgi:hypothetical protein